MEHKFYIIAIDGGSAAGKSSTSKALATKMNLLYVDTGSHYRALTQYMMDKEIQANDLANVCEALDSIHISTKIAGHIAQIFLNDHAYTHDQLRSEAVNANVSFFSTIPELRQFLLSYQRSLVELAREYMFHGIVIEGRDIGSVVLPNAHFKFFLQAEMGARAKRRDREGTKDTIEDRDLIDSTRHTAPLSCPKDAFLIDSTHLSLDDVINIILKKIEHTPIGLSK